MRPRIREAHTVFFVDLCEHRAIERYRNDHSFDVDFGMLLSRPKVRPFCASDAVIDGS
jgi:hypothetical protein